MLVVVFGSSETETERVARTISECSKGELRTTIADAAKRALEKLGGRTATQWQCGIALCVLCALNPTHQQLMALNYVVQSGERAILLASSACAVRDEEAMRGVLKASMECEDENAVILCNGLGCVPRARAGALVEVCGSPQSVDAFALRGTGIDRFRKAAEESMLARRGQAAHFRGCISGYKIFCCVPFAIDSAFLRTDEEHTRRCNEDEMRMAAFAHASASFEGMVRRVLPSIVPHMPPVCVIISTYDRWGKLMDALRSVFAQTLPVAQVIIVDDASTDVRYAMLQSVASSMATRGERVRVIRLPQNSKQVFSFACPGAVRNVGLQCAREPDMRSSCEMIAVLDDDDAWMPNKLEIQLSEMRRRGMYASCTEALYSAGRLNFNDPQSLPRYNAEHFKRNVARHCRPFLSPSDLSRGAIVPQILRRDLLDSKNVVVHSSFICHTNFFPDYPRLRYGRGMDYVMVKETCAALHCILYVDRPLVIYDGRTFDPQRPSAAPQ